MTPAQTREPREPDNQGVPDDSLLLVYGDEPYLVDVELRAWRDRHVMGELAAEVHDAPSKLDALARSLAEMPLFDPERVIVVRDPPQLAGVAKKGADSVEALVSAIRDRAPSTSVCIVHHGALPPTHPMPTAIRDLGGSVAECPRLRGRDVRTWLANAAATRSLRLSATATQHILDVVGGDLGMIAAELDKLSAFAAGQPLGDDDVRRLCAGDSQVAVWTVLELLLSDTPGRGAAAIDALLAEGRPAAYLVATLSGQMRELVTARALLSERRANPADLARTLRLPSWRADKVMRHARQVPGRISLAWVRQLQRIDAQVKTGVIDDAAALRSFARRAALDIASLSR